MIRPLIATLLLALPLLAGDRVKFSDDAYSLEFPQGWKKAKSPTPDAEFARQSADETVIVSVNCSKIPAGAEADLDAMGKATAKNYAEVIQFKGEAKMSDGTLDGCKAKFITMAPQNEEEGQLGMFVILIDSREHLVRVIATMAPQLTNETREACLGVVKSFRREDTDEKKEE
ncbi:PsbP-related protein [Haloferula helveola]